MEVSIESKYRIDHVESGLPRWLIEACTVGSILAFGWVMRRVLVN